MLADLFRSLACERFHLQGISAARSLQLVIMSDRLHRCSKGKPSYVPRRIIPSIFQESEHAEQASVVAVNLLQLLHTEHCQEIIMAN
jgi:hypothetical protein